MALCVILVRNGSTAWSRERRLQGRQDVPLSAEGRAQAGAVALALREQSVNAVYASPLRRAMDTAGPIAAAHGLAVRVHPGFVDVDAGEWEGLTPEEMAARDPEAHRIWVEEPHRVALPGGESIDRVRARVMAGLGDLRTAHAGQTVAVVSHAIPSRIVILEALGLGLDRLWSLALSATGVSEVEFRDDWAAVHRMNSLVHLDQLQARP